MPSRSVNTRRKQSSGLRVAGEVETRCPACGKGFVERVIVSRTFTIEGRPVCIDGLMPDKCAACGELTWSEGELRRADEAIAIKLRKVAA
ncbi:MAG: YgiT-type zinc finger protein [Candidatus Wallbacteria bacterium]|nr:YgiT-type zinc finger protein [Candidatus Wallbacteria bacterium]